MLWNREIRERVTPVAARVCACDTCSSALPAVRVSVSHHSFNVESSCATAADTHTAGLTLNARTLFLLLLKWTRVCVSHSIKLIRSHRHLSVSHTPSDRPNHTHSSTRQISSNKGSKHACMWRATHTHTHTGEEREREWESLPAVRTIPASNVHIKLYENIISEFFFTLSKKWTLTFHNSSNVMGTLLLRVAKYENYWNSMFVEVFFWSVLVGCSSNFSIYMFQNVQRTNKNIILNVPRTSRPEDNYTILHKCHYSAEIGFSFKRV